MTMHCAWCNPSDEGTDGICDDCMKEHFGVDPAEIHTEIEQEAQQKDEQGRAAR